jgi:hypothetical protein
MGSTGPRGVTALLVVLDLVGWVALGYAVGAWSGGKPYRRIIGPGLSGSGPVHSTSIRAAVLPILPSGPYSCLPGQLGLKPTSA